ncbi:4892_t:CDS:2 [Funneliformis mosseae]|uniref:4892_t:CDS:1 n=1 Tax=Funneliformis mosseae TaxID=27381 RepID=A0A9N9FU98_FUNMO|nr:4892_t:CDS:2 [Funneliformis mosseae]
MVDTILQEPSGFSISTTRDAHGPQRAFIFRILDHEPDLW